MDLELHQLDRRYEALRTTSRERDSRVLASLARDGQQLPVVVVTAAETNRYVLVDGYKRVRGLTQLGQDLVRATCWDLPEPEALLLGRLMRSGEGESALEQAWLLRELQERFALTLEELARRFGRSPSWVSRRLGLARELPDAIQLLVRKGKLGPHAAMKHLLPLARANRAGAVALARAIAPLGPSTRQTATLVAAYARADERGRAELLKHPAALLRSSEPSEPAPDPVRQLKRDIGALSGIARRATTQIENGVTRQMLPREHGQLRQAAAGARGDVELLVTTLDKEETHAG